MKIKDVLRELKDKRSRTIKTNPRYIDRIARKQERLKILTHVIALLELVEQSETKP